VEQVIVEVAIIIVSGFVLGIIVDRLGFPRVTGYILAGVLLNPYVVSRILSSPLIKPSFVQSSAVLTAVSLAIITFEVGGSLSIPAIQRLGKQVALITLFEAEMAFLSVASFLFLLFHFTGAFGGDVRAQISVALVMGSLASPTDPSATLAVMKQYKAHGPVSSMIMMVAAFDDALGIINFSIASGVAAVLLSGSQISFGKLAGRPAEEILLSILAGVVGGLIFKYAAKIAAGNGAEESLFVPLLFGMTLGVYGFASMLDLDPLMALMVMGAFMVNFSEYKNQIFHLIDVALAELAFLVFFVISGLRLDFSVLGSSILLSVVYVFARAFGKFIGVYIGGTLGGTDKHVKLFTAGGLIPQGGIVVGLALIFAMKPEFQNYGSLIVSTTIGATILHEIVGPLLAKASLRAAGEI
jgi:Kef-type K+ transport system membrane component KefB